ncbi:MAG: PCP reductase family protein [Myxococcota bacterium]
MAKTKIRWAPDAEAMIKKVPFFVRPLAKRKAEEAAQQRGLEMVTRELVEELRDKNMPS